MNAAGRVLWIVPILAAGCTAYDGGSYPLELPAAAFPTETVATELQPYLTVRCASLDCHGAGGRPLRIYAEDGLRLAPELRGELITDDEMILNLQALQALDPEAPLDSSRTLLKPLSPSAGGMVHEGRTVWSDRDAPGYRCLRAFLAGDQPALEIDAGIGSTCAQAYVPWLPPDQQGAADI